MSESLSATPHLQRPEETQPLQILWPYATVLATLHVLCLLAFIPWLFTWSGLVVAILGHLVFGMFGITIGYHDCLHTAGLPVPSGLNIPLPRWACSICRTARRAG